MSNLSRFLLLAPFLCLSVSTSALFAADEKIEFPSISQHQVVKQRVGLTEIEIDYSRPNKNDREIFGGLVPFGQLWRTGANAPTRIKFSGPVKLEDKEIPAGEYVLATIPATEQWTIILSKDAKMQSMGDYKQENDAARFNVKTAALPETVETFTIGFQDVKGASAMLHLDWDKTRAGVKLTTDDVANVSKKLETAGAKLDPAQAFQAASFYYENNKDMNQAAKWIDAALEKNPNAWFMHMKKAQIQARLGNKKESTAAAEKTIELLKASKTPDEAQIKIAQQIIDSSK